MPPPLIVRRFIFTGQLDPLQVPPTPENVTFVPDMAALARQRHELPPIAVPKWRSTVLPFGEYTRKVGSQTPSLYMQSNSSHW